MKLNLIKLFGLLSFPFLSFQLSGQVEIVADTLLSECLGSHGFYRFKQNQYVFFSQEEFERSEVFKMADDECLPFGVIDFERNVLAGFRYEGSRCDMEIIRSELSLRSGDYLIEFSVRPNVCRDLSRRIAWFLLTRPSEKFNIVIERKRTEN
jgi:hypothetical protein